MTDFLLSRRGAFLLSRRGAFLALGSAFLAACAKKDDDLNSQGEFGNRNGQNGRGGLAGTGPGSSHDFKNNVGDTVQFEEDSSELSSAGRSVLDSQAQWLAKYNSYSFTIEGHADERGTREYNLALGARRSQTVRDYLAAKGVTSSRMRTISYGKERPAAGCDSASCWSQNRRAVTNLGG